MPNWNRVVEEISQAHGPNEIAFETVRRKYLKRLHNIYLDFPITLLGRPDMPDMARLPQIVYVIPDTTRRNSSVFCECFLREIWVPA